MLANSRVSAILPVVDMGRARKFFEEKLGLQASDAPGGVMLNVVKVHNWCCISQTRPRRLITPQLDGKLTTLKRVLKYYEKRAWCLNSMT